MEANMTKIMLVEDDKSLREIYGIRLMAEGYEIKSAGDGEEALAMAIKERPDLIISDVMMPKISGFDMLDILRATPETKDIKIIMMTALSSEDQRARGESLGANRYLVKSQVGIEDVVRTVHDVLTDAPMAAAPSAAKLFGTPVPSATGTNPKSFNLPPQPMSTPTPTPSQSSTMPQPTAPFSTAAPASLGDRIINPVQPVASAPAPIVNISTPFTPPPQQPAAAPRPMPAPTPVITAPVINTAPTPAPAYAPTPVVPTTPTPEPIQDVIAPQPSAAIPAPDIATLIAQELNGPQAPTQ